MTDQLTSNTVIADGSGGYSVIAVSFEDDHRAYEALSALKDLDSQRRVGVQEAVIVVRQEDGHVLEKDRIASMFPSGMTGGGLIGLLLGVIGGPFGMLIGGTAGMFAGSLFDLRDIEEADSALGAISESVRPGHTSLLAVVSEQSPDVVNAAMSALGGTVLRRAVSEVEAEIAAAESAERKASREARKELLRGRQGHDKAVIDAKVGALKDKLHLTRA